MRSVYTKARIAIVSISPGGGPSDDASTAYRAGEDAVVEINGSEIVEKGSGNGTESGVLTSEWRFREVISPSVDLEAIGR